MVAKAIHTRPIVEPFTGVEAAVLEATRHVETMGYRVPSPADGGSDDSRPVACASCGAEADLAPYDDEGSVAFCVECVAPISSIDFPEYYCDLGEVD